MTRRFVAMAVFALVTYTEARGQRSSGPPKGVLIVDGGGTEDSVVREFVRLAGGPEARIVVIPTGASSLRFGPDKIILNPDGQETAPSGEATKLI